MTQRCFLWGIGYLIMRRSRQVHFVLYGCPVPMCSLRLCCSLITINFGSEIMIEKVAFNVKYGHYEYVVITFGVTNVLLYGDHGQDVARVLGCFCGSLHL